MTCRKCGSENLIGGWYDYAYLCLTCGYEWPPPDDDEADGETAKVETEGGGAR